MKASVLNCIKHRSYYLMITSTYIEWYKGSGCTDAVAELNTNNYSTIIM